MVKKPRPRDTMSGGRATKREGTGVVGQKEKGTSRTIAKKKSGRPKRSPKMESEQWGERKGEANPTETCDRHGNQKKKVRQKQTRKRT